MRRCDNSHVSALHRSQASRLIRSEARRGSTLAGRTPPRVVFVLRDVPLVRSVEKEATEAVSDRWRLRVRGRGLGDDSAVRFDWEER